jgi:putative flavoprotein involved in K+ transport
VVVIGGGQAGLAAGFYLRRHGINFAVLDAQQSPGGAWQHVWESLRLFSPAQYSSLPGWQMPIPEHGGYPDTAHVIDYLTRYEQRYQLPVHHGITVHGVHRTDGGFRLDTIGGEWTARVMVSATGTWWQPFIPALARSSAFHWHPAAHCPIWKAAGFRGSAGRGHRNGELWRPDCRRPCRSRGCGAVDDPQDATIPARRRRRPGVVSAGNQRYRALKAGLPAPGGISELGDVVAVPPVRAVRDAGQLHIMSIHPGSGPPYTTSPR